MLKAHVLNLTHKEDLKKAIDVFIREKGIVAGVLLSGLGGLDRAIIQLAGTQRKNVIQGPLDIVSLEGVITEKDATLHISVSDCFGKVMGGKLLDGCLVRAGAEIVIGEMKNLILSREISTATGRQMLKVSDSQ